MKIKLNKMVFRLIIVLFFFSVGAFSQEKYIKHKISKGENLTIIAKKYGVKPKDIVEANPNAPKILKLNSVLLIPNNNPTPEIKSSQPVANSTPGLHEVQSKETLWGISKKYSVSVEDLKKANPSLETEGLKLGQQINIPYNSVSVSEKPIDDLKIVSDVEVIVEVQPKETKYTIAKKYGITVVELEKQNPFIKGKLPIGYVLKIRTSKEKAAAAKSFAQNQPVKKDVLPASEQTTQVTQNPTSATEGLKAGKQNDIQSSAIAVSEKPIDDLKIVTDVEVVVEVQPKETKYAIAKKYGITVAELEKQNPFIKGKLPVGYVLKISTSKEKADAAQAPGQNQEVKTTVSDSLQIVDNSEVKRDSSTVIRVSNHSDLVNQLIVNATENIGIRYRSGGTTKAGFDCSGLMICTFSNFDIKLPRSSIEQSRIGMKVNTDEAQKGDLIFFKTNGRRQINHVGMVVEVMDGEIKFVHSSTHGGVMISSTKEPYYERAFSQVNRVLE